MNNSTPDNVARSQMQFAALRKSQGVCLALWWCLWPVGAHRFYMRKTGSAVVMLVLSMTVVGLAITVVWAAIDLFLLFGWVRRHNLALVEQLSGAGRNNVVIIG